MNKILKLNIKKRVTHIKYKKARKCVHCTSIINILDKKSWERREMESGRKSILVNYEEAKRRIRMAGG